MFFKYFENQLFKSAFYIGIFLQVFLKNNIKNLKLGRFKKYL